MSEPWSFAPIEVELHNGRHVRLREICPDDREEVRQAFDRLSRESRYTRFMSSVKELSPDMLDRAVRRQAARELGLVAEVDAPDGIDIVGGARYYVQADGERCEFAVTVADASATVKAVAHVVTRARGGYGAVRELVELILRAQGSWRQIVDAYVREHGGR